MAVIINDKATRTIISSNVIACVANINPRTDGAMELDILCAPPIHPLLFL